MNPVNYASPLCSQCGVYIATCGPSAVNGQRMECPNCHKVFSKVTVPNGYQVYFVVYTEGKIRDDAPRQNPISRWKSRPLVWERRTEDGQASVYFPCGQCGRILRVYESDIGPSDAVEQPYSGDPRTLYPCVKCDHCACHVWPRFEGFTASKADMIESKETP